MLRFSFVVACSSKSERRFRSRGSWRKFDREDRTQKSRHSIDSLRIEKGARSTFRLLEKPTTTGSRRILFFMDFCFACCVRVLLIYYFYCPDDEAKWIYLENEKKKKDKYIYMYMVCSLHLTFDFFYEPAGCWNSLNFCFLFSAHYLCVSSLRGTIYKNLTTLILALENRGVFTSALSCVCDEFVNRVTRQTGQSLSHKMFLQLVARRRSTSVSDVVSRIDRILWTKYNVEFVASTVRFGTT